MTGLAREMVVTTYARKDDCVGSDSTTPWRQPSAVPAPLRVAGDGETAAETSDKRYILAPPNRLAK